MGATMLFGEKYGADVRVIEIPGYSMELCGGTHVSKTAEIGPFVILSESSVGSGVRRIEAVTSGDAYAYLQARSDEVDALRDELARVRKEKPEAARAEAVEVDAEVKPVEGVNVIAQRVDGLGADALLDLSDRFKQRNPPAAVVLGSVEDGRVHLVCNFDESVAERVSASDVARAAAAVVGGGGGGRPTMARAGGTDPEKLADALAEAERLVVGALTSVRVIALDFGRARTGVAVSDPTGELARPLTVVEAAATPAGLTRVAEIAAEHEVELVVVGLPLTLKGEWGEQARETERFVEALRTRLAVPVELFDERFTSTLAEGDDAKAAAHLLSDYLAWRSR